MKRYRSYTAKKFRLPRRIIFFSLIAVVIVVLAVILGNVLKNRLENTPRDTSDILTTTDPNEDKPQNDEIPENDTVHDEAYKGVVAGYLDLSSAKSGEEAEESVSMLWEKGFNAVSFSVTDENGMITYASPAVEKHSRLPASGDIVSFEILKSAVQAAKSLSMRVSGVMSVSESLSDELVAEELCSIGFDEMIIRGFEKYTQFDNEKVSEVSGYISDLRGAAQGMAFSLSFESEFYKAPYNAPYIEKIYENVDFLSINMTDMTSDEIGSAAGEMTGSFSAYLLRPLLSGIDEEAAAAVNDVLNGANIKARQYVSAPQKTVDPVQDNEDRS